MNEEKITRPGEAEALQIPQGKIRDRYYRPSLERLRIILMFFMCINLFDFPISIGGIVQAACGFVPIAFFILSGYLVLREDEDRSARIARAIKRTAITFVIMTVAYFLLNVVYYYLMDANIFDLVVMPRFWFNFLVLNVWQFDIGSAIWYVQALLYAYVIIYFLEKAKLLRFDWLIFLILIAFTVVTGELCGIIKWEIAGYIYVPGNFLTRALPYTLLGCLMHRKMPSLIKRSRFLYVFGVVFGIFLVFAEILVFGFFKVPGYYGHAVGMGVTAFSVCMLAFQNSSDGPGFEAVLGLTRRYTNWIYYLAQPVSLVIIVAFSLTGNVVMANVQNYMGIITFVVCFFIAWVMSFIGRRIRRARRAKHRA